MMRSMPEAIYSRDTNLFRAYLEENLAEGRLKGFEANLLREVCKQGKPQPLTAPV